MKPYLPIPPGTFIHPSKPWPSPPGEQEIFEEREKEVRSAPLARGMVLGVALGLLIFNAIIVIADYQIVERANWICEYRP